MIPISAQASIVNQAIMRLPLKKPQRDALVEARETLRKLELLRIKLVKSTERQAGDFDDIAADLVDLLGLEAKPVVTLYGDGKHAPVPQG
jgi:hypothetical protein